MPLVSVIVPTRDRPELLRQALDSVLGQTFGDWECIVVNDGGRSKLTLPEDRRFRIIDHEFSRGPAEARNSGLSVSRGRYVSFLDDDDLYTKRRLETLLPHLREGVIAIGSIRNLDGSPHNRSAGRWNGFVGPRIVSFPPHVGQGLYPRRSVEYFDASFRTAETHDWWFRMGASHSFTTIKDVGYLFRWHSGERLDIGDRTRLENRRRLISKHKQWFLAHPDAYALQLSRCASEAYRAHEVHLAKNLALESLRVKPSRLAMKLLVRTTVLRYRATADSSGSSGGS